MAGQHAKLSPSSAERWMACPGSMRMEEGLADTSSRAADEGTAAHFLASECLTAEVNANVHLLDVINICVDNITGEEVCLWNSTNHADYTHRTSFVVGEDMVRHVQTYIDLCREHMARDKEYFGVECSKSIEFLTGEKDAKGTIDFHLVADEKVVELVVIDLKYGHTPVQAKDNKQLIIYALSVIEDELNLINIDRVRLIISQPRVFDEPSVHVISVAELQAFAEEVKTAARRAMSVQKDANGNVMGIQLNPGEAQCKYCKAKLKCPKFGQQTSSLVLAQFKVIPEQESQAELAGQVDQLVASYTPQQLNDMANKVGLVKQWCKAVEDARDHYLLEQNGQLADWKVVQGNEGSRMWVNEAAAEAEMKRMKIRAEHMYTHKLVTAPQAEKLFKTKIIGERQWPKLQELITRKPGGKTVVPSSDKRPALTHVADQFDVVAEVVKEVVEVVKEEVNVDEFI